MAFNFPDTPTLDQEFFAIEGLSYIWDGAVWNRKISGGGNTPPPSDIEIPSITGLTPTSMEADGSTQNLIVDGTDFPPNSEVLLDDVAVATTFVSDTQLSATVTTPVIEGSDKVKVSGSLAVESNKMTLNYVSSGVNPDISSLNPTSLSSSAGTTLVDCIGLSGAGTESFYSPDAIVVMDGRDMPTTYHSVGLLRFEVTGTDWAPGTYPVIVRQIGGVSDPAYDFLIA
jgi:hypothetical protein